jgi:hypothetical protein
MGTDINIKKRIAVQEESVTITSDVNSINITGDGATASAVGNDVTINIPGGTGSITYYLNQSVTQAPYKEFSSIPTAAAEQTILTTIGAGATSTIQSFQTASGIPGTTNIPAGLWSFYLHFSGTGANTFNVYVEVYKRDLGGIETLLLTTDSISTTPGVSPSMTLTDGVFPATTLLTTDRIVVKVKAQNTEPTPSPITFHTEGTTNYSVSTTTLNQTLPTGAVTSVTGTAPVVSSGGTTPAISMPQATALVDGYLDNADWSTFNGKQDPISLTTTGTSGPASFLANVLNIPQYQAQLLLTTTGTSGPATLIGNTLNIPSYSFTDTNIYNTDGTLTGNRIVTMNANTLLFDGTNSDVRYTPNSVGGYLQLEGKASGVPRFGISVPAFGANPAAGFQLGMRAWDDATYVGYGQVGDAFFYAGNATYGLNFLNPPGVGTADYIRFYAGIDATGTSHMHIQGTGATKGYVGLGTETPAEKLDVVGKTKTTTFQMTTSPTAGYVLTSDASGNGSWTAPSTGTVTSVGLTAGTGISLAGTNPITSSGSITVTNSAPDQTVVLNAGTGIGVTGTYPNFTISNTATASSGIWGISNALGVYTYYATLSAAMTAAVAGQTIELFADYTDSGTSIGLKNQVNINLNGHTYTWASTAASVFAFTTSGTGTCQILNGRIVADDSATYGGCVLIYLSTVFTVITDVYFNNTQMLTVQLAVANSKLIGGVYYAAFQTGAILNNGGIVENVDVTGVGSVSAPINSTGGSLVNCIGRSTPTGAAGALTGITASNTILTNCTGIAAASSSNSYGLYITNGTAQNCVGYSSGNTGLKVLGSAILNNCVGRSDGNYGIEATSCTLNGCVGYSTANIGFIETECNTNNCQGYSTASAGYQSLFNSSTYKSKKNIIGHSTAANGIYIGGLAYVQNCSAFSSASFAFQVGDTATFPAAYGNLTMHNCSAISRGDAAISVVKNSNTSIMKIMNCSATSDYNFSSGHGLTSQGSATSGLSILNCVFTVTNSAAFAIDATAAQTINYAGNAYLGCTTPIDSLITQGIVNTEDNQGNILV